jgi:hypothetical protein
MSERPNAVLFQDFVNARTNESVLIARTKFDKDVSPLVKHDLTVQLDALRADGACVFNSDLLGGYTIIKLAKSTARLVVATSAVCLVIGFAFIGRRCAVIVLLLTLTYASLLGAISMLGFDVDMIILVALLITPGLITDYALHMAHDVRNAEAVVVSALTSILSLVPFTTVAVVSIRNFMLLYILMIAFGCVWTIALLYPVHRYYQAVSDESEQAAFVIE